MSRPLHQSGAKVAANCLARYHAEYVEGIRTDGPYSQLGTAVHAAIEAAFRGTATGNREPLDCALEGLAAWIADHEDAVPLWVASEAEKLLRRAYAEDSSLWLRLPGRGQTVSVEQRWHLDEEFAPLTSDDGAAYAGRFDILQYGSEGLFLRDVKTIMSMPGKDSIPYDIQAQVYAMAALALFPTAPQVTFSLILVRHDYETRHVFTRGGPWERRIKRWLRDVRVTVRRAAERDEWPETPGEGCRYCPVMHRCTSLRALIDAGSVTDGAPEDVARAYLAAKAVAGPAETDARAFAENAPIVVGTGKVLGYRPGTKRKLKPLADLLALLDADGVTREDIAAHFPGASISKKGLKSLAVEMLQRGDLDGAPREWIEMFTDEVPSVTFTTFLAAVDDDE